MIDVLEYFTEETADHKEDIKSIYDTRLLSIELDREKEKLQHQEAIDKGYLPYSFNECYGKQLTRYAYIFIQRIEGRSDQWTSYRITYNFIDESIKSEKTIVEGTDLTQIIIKTERYIEKYCNYINR